MVNFLTTPASLSSRSKSALSTFRKAMKDLSSVSEDASKMVSKNEEKILSIKTENLVLSKIVDDNEKVIKNISNLLGE